MTEEKTLKQLCQVLEVNRKDIGDFLGVSQDELLCHQMFSELLKREMHNIQVMSHVALELRDLNKMRELALGKIDYLAGFKPANMFVDGYTNRTREWITERFDVYEELADRAYGKTVVLTGTEDKIFHIAQANVGFPEIGVINRLAPVAQILVSAEVGETIELPLGTFTVVAVAILTPLPRTSSWNILANFSYMALGGYQLDQIVEVSDLSKAYSNWRTDFMDTLPVLSETALLDEELVRDWQIELGLTDFAPPSRPIEYGDISSLGACFYTNTTKAQEEIIRRERGGLAVVLGVAGTGKTSVALGRAKALCDKRFEDDERHRDSFFLPTKSVGFVLNGQLTEYLKDTRDKLALYNMQVKEYHELRTILRQFRKINRGETFHRENDVTNGCEGQIPWLYAADKSMALLFKKRLREILTKPLKFPWKLTPPQMHFVIDVIWANVLREVDSLNHEGVLEENHSFKVEGLYAKLQRIREQIHRIFASQDIWIRNPSDQKWFRSKSLEEAANQIISSGISYAQSIPGDSKDFRELSSLPSQATFILKKLSKYCLKKGASLDENTTQNEMENMLSREDIYRKCETEIPVICEQHDIENAIESGRLYWRNSPDQPWSVVEAIVWIGQVRRMELTRRYILSILQKKFDKALDVCSAYATSILSGSLAEEARRFFGDNIEEQVLAEDIEATRRRIESKALSDSDIDVLLSITNLMSVGNSTSKAFTGISHWSEPDYYSQVFIDEFQDFTEIQVFLMSEQADPKRRAVTAVGDIRQQLTPKKIKDIRRCFPRAAEKEVSPFVLLENKRQTQSLAELSQRFRTEVLGAPKEEGEFKEILWRCHGITVSIVEEGKTREQLERILLDTPDTMSVAVICPNRQIAIKLEMAVRDDLAAAYRETLASERRDLCRPFFIHFTVPIDVKGLEFDIVVAPCFDEYDLNDPIEANSAYVAITRAREQLTIMGSKEILSGPFSKIASALPQN